MNPLYYYYLTNTRISKSRKSIKNTQVFLKMTRKLQDIVHFLREVDLLLAACPRHLRLEIFKFPGIGPEINTIRVVYHSGKTPVIVKIT